jgi:hypothetical protein
MAEAFFRYCGGNANPGYFVSGLPAGATITAD